MSSYLPKRLRYAIFMIFRIVILISPSVLFAQACPSPHNTGAVAITMTSADLTWISPADTFEIELWEYGADTSSYQIVTTHHYLWTGLSPATTYYYKVRAVCDGMLGSASGSFPFVTHLPNPTTCGVNLDIANHIIDCDFRSNFYVDVTSAPGTALGSDVILTSVKLLIRHEYDSDLTISLIAPDGTSVLLSQKNGLDHNNYGNPYDTTCQELCVFVDGACATNIEDAVTSDNDSTNFVGLFEPEEPLSNFSESGGSPIGTWTLKICDDHEDHLGSLEYAELVFAPINCVAPNQVHTSYVAGTYVSLDWNELTVPDSVILEYGSADFVPGTGSQLGGGTGLIRVAGNIGMATLTGLDLLTDYHVYLRSKCGSSFSKNVCFAFTTSCSDPTIIEDFDDQAICPSSCKKSCTLSGTWHNLQDDGSDWLVHKGTTPSGSTGPSYDVSGTGNYIYTEASFCSDQHSRSVLQSNCLFVGAGTEGGCGFSFQWHLYGASMGSLKLLAHTDGSAGWDTLWALSGDQGDMWHLEFIDLSAYLGQVVQLRFEGIRGGSSSDMALDELIFYGNTLDLGPTHLFYADVDGDGFGDANHTESFCGSSPPAGYTTDDTDCDDQNNSVYPGAPEILCNQLDENCNGMADDTILPVPAANPVSEFCASGTKLFLINDAPIGEYYWYSADGNIIGSGQNAILPNLEDGDRIYVVDSVSGAGYTCKSGLAAVDVVIHPEPFIGLDTIVDHCSGQPFSLSSLPMEDTSGQEISVSVYGDLPLVAANLITTDTIFSEDYSSLYYHAVTTNGCQDVRKVSFNVLQSPEVAISPLQDTVELCPSEIAVMQAGVVQGVAPYSYEWSNGFETPIALAQTTYGVGAYSPLVVKLTDGTGCFAKDTVAIGNNLAVSSIQIQDIQDVSTCGGSDGHFRIIPQGGVPPYTISWTGPVSGDTANVTNVLVDGLTQGAYNIQISDSSPAHCVSTFSGVVINAPGLNVELDTVQPISCYGESDGVIALNVTGLNPVFQWSDGITTEDRFGLSGGVYSVTISDASCTLSIENIEVQEPDSLQAFVAGKEDVSCYGAANGLAQLNVFGGVKPYNYLWNGPTPVTGDSLTNLIPGDYTCVVIDYQGCSATPVEFSISEPDSLGFSSQVEEVTCYGMTNGRIEVTGFGGSPPYQYAWNLPDITGRINQDLGAGTYGCTVTDANGCSVSKTYVLSEPPEIQMISLAKVEPTCLGLNDGSLDAFGQGGTGSLKYYWDTFPEGHVISQIPQGYYSLLIKDSIGCVSDTIWATLNAIQQIVPYVDSIRDISCHGLANGHISVFPTGGHFPYDFLWSTGAQTEDLDDVGPGAYELTITDAIGCQISLDSLLLEEPEELVLNVVSNSVKCHGESSGRVYSYALGGSLPYRYSWNTGDTIPDLLDVAAGMYNLTLTDAHNCVQIDSSIVTEPDYLSVEINHLGMAASCGQGASLGSIQLTVDGGQTPYHYHWNTGAASEDLYNLMPGEYGLTVTDDVGCTLSTKPIRIYQTDTDFVIKPEKIKNVQCFGAQDGEIIFKGVGGTLPYNFNWSNGSTTSSWVETPLDTISQLEPGVYQLTITDAKGCTTVSDSLPITEPEQLYVNLDSINQNPCSSAMQGQIFTTAYGGQTPYHYLWNTFSNEPDPDSLSSGIYTVTVVDGNDCRAHLPDAVELVGLLDSLEIQVDEVINQNCQNTGSIFISVPSTLTNPQFIWSNQDTTEDITGLLAGFYRVTVFDESGCSSTLDSIEVKSVQNVMSLVLDSIHNVSCPGLNDGAIVVSVEAGLPPYSYYWSTNQHDSLMIDNLSLGNYSVTVVDANLCVALSGGLSVGEPDSMDYTSVITDSKLTQAGSIELILTGGIAPYTYIWDAMAQHQTTNPATNLKPGTYSVTVTDHNLCELVIDGLEVGGVVGTASPQAKRLKVFPNPASDIFYVDWPSGKTVDLSLISALGQRYSPHFRPKGRYLEVTISDLPSGIYLVEIVEADGLRRVGVLSK